jgi:hypothetical protein
MNANNQAVPNRDQDNPAQQPFQFTLPTLISSTGGACTETQFAVPAGQRLVIEYIDARLTFATTGVFETAVTAGGKGATYQWPISALPGSSSGVGNQMVRLYADPGSNVTVEVCPNSTTAAETSGAISGYLVNIP